MSALTEKSLQLCTLVLKIVQVDVLIFRSCSKAGGGDSGIPEMSRSLRPLQDALKHL